MIRSGDGPELWGRSSSSSPSAPSAFKLCPALTRAPGPSHYHRAQASPRRSSKSGLLMD